MRQEFNDIFTNPHHPAKEVLLFPFYRWGMWAQNVSHLLQIPGQSADDRSGHQALRHEGLDFLGPFA